MPPRSKKSTKKPAAKRGKGAKGAGGKRGAKPTHKGPKRKKRAPQPRSDDPRDRLQKVLAAAGIASRRECELLIQEGRVEVDSEVVTELGTRVDPFSQKIRLDGELLPTPKRVYFAVNKPEGVVCTARDPSGRPRVTDLVPPDSGRVFAVGRLDMASEGLILVTNDGELANGITHPRHEVHKTYHVKVQGHPTAETLAQLRKGVRLAEGKAHFVHAKVKSRRKNSTILEVVLDEGRNREIRRVLARVDHKVQNLTRVAVGPVKLGDMPPGAYRPLNAKELKALRAAIAAPPGAAAKTGPARKPSRSAAQLKSTQAKSASAKPTLAKSTPTPKKKNPPQGKLVTPASASADLTASARTILGDANDKKPANSTKRGSSKQSSSKQGSSKQGKAKVQKTVARKGKRK